MTQRLDFDILETHPEELVSIIDTDVEVEFEQSHDVWSLRNLTPQWNPRKWCFKQQRSIAAAYHEKNDDIKKFNCILYKYFKIVCLLFLF